MVGLMSKNCLWIFPIVAVMCLFAGCAQIGGNASSNSEPFMQCADCSSGKAWNNLQCCSAGFDGECTSKNGVVRVSDLHPSSTWMKGCFQKASDAGKVCSSNKECSTGVCDLASAAASGNCTLIEKVFTGEKNRFSNQKFYTATYSCQTPTPGRCAEAIESRTNPGGVLHDFYMNGSTLIEIMASGPIY